MSHPLGRQVLSRLKIGGLAVVVAFAFLPAQLTAQAQEGGGDPSAVNFYVYFPDDLRLTSSMNGTVAARSGQAGPTRTPYRGRAVLGIESRRGSDTVRDPAATLKLRGVAQDTKTLRLRWSARQLRAVRRAARAAGRRSVLLNVELRGEPDGPAPETHRRFAFRIRLR
jgi:hypothetical protein